MERKMKHKIESAVSQAMIKFLKVQMGEEIETVITQVMGDIVIVKVEGILPLVESHMVRNQQGQRLIKDLKGRLIEKAKPLLEAMIKDLTDLTVKGIKTTIPFHLKVLNHSDFQKGEYSVKFIEKKLIGVKA